MTATLRSVAGEAAHWRGSGLKVGFTNGCFDLLHFGHLQTLLFAKSHCSRLIVAVDDDDLVAELKGRGRPIVPAVERLALVAALKPVDVAMIFGSGELEGLIKAITPDVLVKGEEYRGKTDIVGAAFARKVLFSPMAVAHSTTRVIACAKGQDT